MIAPTADQATIIWRYIDTLLQESHISTAIESRVRSPFPSLRVGGSEIHARGSGNDGAYLRGHGADKVILDEAAYIPFKVIDEVIPPMLAASPYGQMELISTPWGTNHFWDYWTKGQQGDPDIKSFRFPSTSNPLLSPSYLEQQKRDMTEMAYAIEYGAEFREDQAAVFPWTLIQKCIADIEPEPIPGRRYVAGYDPAKWVDRSGLVILDATQRPWEAVSVEDISGRDYLKQAPVVKDTAARYNGAKVLLDSTSHDQLLEQLKRDGVNVAGYQFTSASKEELINGLVIAMEQGDVKIPNHRDLIDELKYYRYELTRGGNVRLGAPDRPGIHDDLVTALALAVHAAKTEFMAPKVTPVDMTRANPFAF